MNAVLPFAAALCLAGVTFYALLTARDLIRLLFALQLLTGAVVLALVSAGRMSGQLHLGQSLAVTVLVADTVVLLVGLALALQLHARFGSLELAELAHLRERAQRPEADHPNQQNRQAE